MNDADAHDAVRRAELVLALRGRGIVDRAVISAIEAVPRERFIDAGLRRLAYLDVALPIDCGQTIEAPSQIALMVQALDLAPGHRVLEIGTGSGYMAAVLAQITRAVTTIDRYRTLIDLARTRFEALGITTITAAQADGQHGYGAAAPYDRIVSAVAMDQVPAGLTPQLKPGGVLVAPLGRGAAGVLTRVTRADGGDWVQTLGAFAAQPLVPGIAAAL